MAFWTNLEMSSHGGGGASLPHSHSSPSGMYPTPSSPECRSLGKRLPVQVHFLDDSVASFNIQVSVNVFIEFFFLFYYILFVSSVHKFFKSVKCTCTWTLLPLIFDKIKQFFLCCHQEQLNLEFWVLFFERKH